MRLRNPRSSVSTPAAGWVVCAVALSVLSCASEDPSPAEAALAHLVRAPDEIVDRRETSGSTGSDLPAVVVDLEGARLVLPEGVGVLYRFELRCPSELRIEGNAPGPGRLDLQFSWTDPSTGATEPLSQEPFSTHLSSGVSSERVRLPAPDPGRVLACELTWWPEQSATSLELTGRLLGVLEPGPGP